MKNKAKKLLNYFLKGLLVTLPFAVTIGLIRSIVNWMDTFIDSIIKIDIPGVGFLIVISLITLLGYVGSSIITKPLFSLIDDFLSRIPFVKIIYTSVKDFMEAFVGDKRKFNEPVIMEFAEGVYKPGFITQKDLSHLDMPGYVLVYCPHSYAFSGNVFFVAKEKIKPFKGNAADAMKFMVSGGVTNVD